MLLGVMFARREAGTASGGCGDSHPRVHGSVLSSSLIPTGYVQQDSFEGGGAGATMSPDETIQRILELSADAQIARRRAAKDSPAFHTLTVDIAAYGRVLALLVALQRAGKNSPRFIAQLGMPQSGSDPQAAVPRPFISSLLKQTSVSSSN